ncbi:MAG: hypothetical protein AAF721_22140 [Myxococcota bacterium]
MSATGRPPSYPGGIGRSITGPKARRSALRKLLAGGVATTQGELCALLAERGHATTQSTVSRDLKLLGAERVVAEDGTVGYRLATRARAGVSPDMITSVEHNEAMVVIRTGIGRAQAVGLDLDALGLADVMGTVAGDDTVLVVPRSVHRTAALADAIRTMVGL